MISDPNNGHWQFVVGEQFKRLVAAIARNLNARETRP